VDDQRNRHVLVTGGSGGLGRAVVYAFAHRGALIGVHYSSNAKAAEETAAGARHRGAQTYTVQADFSHADAAETVVRAVQQQKAPLDVLVLNAGVADAARVVNATADQWDHVLTVNYRAHVRLMRVLGSSALRTGSHVVAIGSLVGLRGAIGLAAYAAAKGALLGFVRDAAAHWGTRGILVNGVLPGLLRTAMLGEVDDKTFAGMVAQNVLGRANTCEEVARTIEFISTLKNVSGQMFALDSRLHPDGHQAM
jgi:3-oxoacyl-[acyl-carrier protein] reductase